MVPYYKTLEHPIGFHIFPQKALAGVLAEKVHQRMGEPGFPWGDLSARAITARDRNRFVS